MTATENDYEDHDEPVIPKRAKMDDDGFINTETDLTIF